MLTSDLVRARVSGRTITPQWIDPEKASLREPAEQLVALIEDAAARRARRSEIDDGIAEIVSDRRDHKILRGLAKLVLDRCDFDTAAPVEPSALRLEVFREARVQGPLALAAGPLGRTTADQVLATVAARHDLTAAQVSDALYADLKEQQRLQSARVPSAEWLLHRYNVALAQALLLKAAELHIVLDKPTSPRMRQLFRWVKFHQLIHRARRDGKRLVLVLDGPSSLFRQSTRYGLQLANFLPALLLQKGPWRLEAEVLWTRAEHRKQLVITHEQGLVSHYADAGAWRSREQQYFAERFRALDSGWTLDEGEVPLVLGARQLVFPDFTLRKGDRVAHLEIVGFWRRESLQRRVEALQDFAPGNLVLAISRRLRGCAESLTGFPGEVIEFAEVLSPKRVVAAVERCARDAAWSAEQPEIGPSTSGAAS